MLDSYVKTRVRQFDPDAASDRIDDIMEIWCKLVKALPGTATDLPGTLENAQLRMKTFLLSKCDIFVAIKNGKAIAFAAVEGSVIRSFVVLAEYDGLRIERHLLDHVNLIKGSELSVEVFISDLATRGKFKKLGFIEDDGGPLVDEVTTLPQVRMKLL